MVCVPSFTYSREREPYIGERYERYMQVMIGIDERVNRTDIILGIVGIYKITCVMLYQKGSTQLQRLLYDAKHERDGEIEE